MDSRDKVFGMQHRTLEGNVDGDEFTLAFDIGQNETVYALVFQTVDGTFVNIAGEPVDDPGGEMRRQYAEQRRARMHVVHRKGGIEDEYF